MREIKQWRIYYKNSIKNPNKVLSKSLLHGYGYINYYGYKKRNTIYEDSYGEFMFSVDGEFNDSYSLYTLDCNDHVNLTMKVRDDCKELYIINYRL